jgi:hypothetical protein
MSAAHIAPLTGGEAVEAGGVLGQACVDDPLMCYYFEGHRSRSIAVCKTMTLATRLTLRHGFAFRLDVE